MTPPQALVSVLRRPWRCDGRARRAEFWWWTLAYVLVFAVLVAVWGGSASPRPTVDLRALSPAGAVATALLLPHVAVTVRRLHDLSLPGWWALGYLAPFGVVGMLVVCALGGSRGPNRYGPDPRGLPAPADAVATGTGQD